MNTKSLTITAAVIAAGTLTASSQYPTKSVTNYAIPQKSEIGELATPAPKTTRERVESIRRNHGESLDNLITIFNRIPAEPQLISSQDVVDAIDLGDRAMKQTVSACITILDALDQEAKRIKADSSFTDAQKAELLAASESLAHQCVDLSNHASAISKNLNACYQEMRNWRKIHKTYLNLEGPAKATEQLKAAVDTFVNRLAEKPESSAKASPSKGG